MRRRFKLISLLAVIIAGTLTFANRPFSFIASATYVEDSITQDTVWTLTDSPFVVSKDVIVYPGVTLTIDPGVEVRFGGDFSLIVNGSLSACGTENNTIIFTSNKDQPEAGDWNAIEFGQATTSTLEYCVVQYAKNAITIENGNVEIENCEIANNSESGIYVTGDNQVTVTNNKISSNKNGILLTGNSITGVNITENIVMSNTQSGIQLDADYYRDPQPFIQNNILSANHHGFHVSGEATTNITRNYILNNTIGIFYASGKDHVAHYNDIYGNERGMDVSSDTREPIVNAEYNYWGHESGPYHISLNPAGKGDPVGGNGINLDFIFSLTTPIDYPNIRPVARLLTDKTLVAPNQAVTFIATTSSDEGRVDKYFFNFGDRKDSGWTTLSIFVHNYSSVGTYGASLIVKDDFNATSTNDAMATIDVQDLTPLQVSLTTSNYTVDYGRQVPLTVHVTDGTHPIENADITLLSITGGSFTPSSGLTNSTGYFITTFTAPNVTTTTNIRIIATASKIDYADGSDYKYLEILPPLLVEVTEPSSVESEETTTVTAHVTYNGQPVAEALVVVSVDNGSVLVDAKFTNLNGNAEFIFTAPQTLIQQNINITATAAKIGYLEGYCRATITVTPKVLVVEVTANSAILISETISNVTVHVTHNMRPVLNTTVTISSDNGGNFSAETGITDSNGDAIFTFLAPPANTPLKITITANATKTGYISGEDYVQMIVYPGTLNVEVTANPATVESGVTSVVIAHVTCNATPVANANVEMSSDYGNFSINTGITDSDGYYMLNFTTPQVTEELSITITANATKNGYKSAEDRTEININPEALMIEVIADPLVVKSEEAANVTVHVTHIGQLVADALVTIWSDGGGNFSATNGTTDSNGDCTFNFSAPQTTTQLNINITATATKAGYADGQGQTKIVIEPKILVVELTADPITVNPEEISYLTVHVTYNMTPISDVNVTMSSVHGTFSPETGTTDSNGNAIFVFTTPQTTTQLNINITATATKTGYADGEAQKRITVNPQPGGWIGLPLITILIIAVLIVVVVIVVLLIKLKVIYISRGEE